MAKAVKPKTLYICQECGTQHLKFQGKCDGCGKWGTLVEEIVYPSEKKAAATPTAPLTGRPSHS